VSTSTGSGSINADATALAGVVSSSITISSNPDTQKPVPGNNGRLTITTTRTSAAVVWTSGTDNTTPQSLLQYQGVISSINNVNTIPGAERARVVRSYTADINGFVAEGLSPNFRYCFNVLIKDQASNVTVYSSACDRTQR
jgi:hypothetical protein